MALFDHLVAMTDERGLFEHAQLSMPRPEHGYCTDDNARLLVITAREPDEGDPAMLSRVALRFLLAAQTPDGQTHNRLSVKGWWTDTPSTDDCWGRSLWAYGVASSHHDDRIIRERSLEAFLCGAQQRSLWPRSMAFAALGAAEISEREPGHTAANAVLSDALSAIGTPLAHDWYWPEPRLSYANASLAEAVIAAGACLDRTRELDQGLNMLAWLLRHQTLDDHLSVTGCGGASRSSVPPQFDQQPIEVAALADACWRAYLLTGSSEWKQGLRLAAEWFHGANDSGFVMFDPDTGGGFDGLTPTGVNLNQGAESTIAFVSTMQRCQTLLVDAS